MAIVQGSVSDNTFHMICDIPMCGWEYYNSGPVGVILTRLLYFTYLNILSVKLHEKLFFI